jgi:transposase
VAAIQHAVVVEKRSRRSVAKAFKVGRKTIDRYVDGDAEPELWKKILRPSPKTDAARAKLEELIAKVPTKERKKHRLTAYRAHELLRADKVDVGYTVVKALIAERRLAAKAVSVPLTFQPGEVAEVDFFEVVVVVDGVEQAA